MLICICMLNKRTQILFDQDLWQKLVAISRAQKVSIGELVRGAVKEKYTRDLELAERNKVLEDIEKVRPAPFKGKIDYKELISYGRK